MVGPSDGDCEGDADDKTDGLTLGDTDEPSKGDGEGARVGTSTSIDDDDINKELDA